jgi:hypothetical protein
VIQRAIGIALKRMKLISDLTHVSLSFWTFVLACSLKIYQSYKALN